MKKYLIVMGCLLSASLFFACQNTSEVEDVQTVESEVEATKEPWQPTEVYEATELALLMRNMWEDNMELREKIMAGAKVDSFPKSYYTIHTAEATDPEEITDVYHSFADMYLNSMNELVDPSKEGTVIAYNNMVKTCIACHREYCQGPIPKIKKLYIPE